MIDWDYFLVSFKSFHGPAESLEVVFRKHWVHHLPRFLAFWLKPPLLSNNICEYWFCKQWAAGLDSFHNTLTVLFWSVEIPIPLLVCKHFSDWTIIIQSLLLLLYEKKEKFLHHLWISNWDKESLFAVTLYSLFMFCSSYSFFFFFLLLCSVAQSCPTLWLRGQQHTKLLCPWNFPCKNTGVGCNFILQRIFPTQISDLCLLCLLHWQVVSLPLVLPFSSVQFSRTVMSNSLWPHELQHARPPHPSPTPGVHSDSHPSSQWCHPALSSYVVPFSSCPQSFLASISVFQWVSSSHQVVKVLEL